MEIKRLITGPLEVNTYVIYGKIPGECAIIDPSGMELIDAFLREKDLRPTDILLTHGHFDHIIAVAELCEKYECCVHAHEADADAFTDGSISLAAMNRFPIKVAKVDDRLQDGDRVVAAGITFLVLHTPGHSKGSVSYVIDEEDVKAIFCGDTLFRLSVGRTDMPNGNANELYDSINYKLFTLQGDYKVYPGHMGETTLEFERKNNPFMGKWGPETW